MTTKKVLIAGSTLLADVFNTVSDALRLVSNNNSKNVLIRAYTYEDIDNMFSQGGGKQEKINRYIREDADYVIFVLEEEIGGVTKTEFDIAWETFMTQGRPGIYVYHRPAKIISPEIQEVIDKINDCHQYYTKYNDLEFLKLRVQVDFLKLINKSVEPNPLEVKKVVNEESKIRMSETQKHLRLRKDESEEKWDVNKALALLPDYFKDDVFLFSKDYDNGGVKIIYNTDYRIKSLIEIPSSISFKDQVFKVTGISNEAFYGCNKLEVITIPNSVVCIEEYAFKNCKSLVSITLSKNITYIGKGAFSGCTSLKSIDVPNGVKRLDYDVFLECTSLREITLPASIEEVEYSAFQGCDSIKKVFIPSSMKKKYAHLLTRGMYKNVVCEQEPKNQKIKWIILCSIVLGISLLIIGVLAFSRKLLQFEYDNTDMTATVMEKQPTFRVTGDVEIPSHVNRLGKVYTVTKIGDNAFKDAYSVAHVTIPSSISYIGSNAFSNCSSLTTIIIPNSVRDLSSCAFEKCIGLTSVTIGKNIQYISSFAFSECVSLDSIYYTGTIKQWERIIKGGFWVDKVPADVIHCVDGDVELRR